jgi:DNA-binding NarL/FixJ family response regulator
LKGWGDEGTGKSTTVWALAAMLVVIVLLSTVHLAVLIGECPMPRNGPRVLIADDHTLVVDLCKRLLETEFYVVGTVADGRALIRAAANVKPDVIVVDIAMPVLNGLDAGRQVKELMPAIKVIFLTMNPDPQIAAEAFRCGASGYLLKTCASSELILAVRDVLRGKSYMSHSL